MSEKKLVKIYSHGSQHWVGDGFPVRNYTPSNDLDQQLNPFILLDYAGPAQFPPSNQPHGVGEHPHRGFETVTIAYQGSVAHRDSAGNHGVIHPGDVQWMTAATGVVHEEMHEQNFAKQGGIFELIQLWVNLPKQYKMSAPRYQTLTKQMIPTVTLADKQSYVRVIAGEFQGTVGVAKTFTPINLFDCYLAAQQSLQLNLTENYSTAIFLLRGHLIINQTEAADASSLLVFTPAGTNIHLHPTTPCQLLILNGEPINEPIVRHGPFVMNTIAEIKQAYEDYQSGKMGVLN